MNPHGPTDPEPHDDSIEATAAAWLAQRDDGLSDEETAEFSKWRNADVRHETAVQRLEVTLEALHTLSTYRPQAAQHPDRNLLDPAEPASVSRFPRWTLVAAAMLTGALIVLTWLRFPLEMSSESAAPLTYATTTGGFQRVALADGSIIELNSDSEAVVEFGPHFRLVHLTRGEADFTVAKNKERPFIVSAGHVAVRAVGTAFNVRLADRSVDVLVTEGTVKVAKAEAAPSTGQAFEPHHELATVTAGQRVLVPAETAASTEKPQVENVSSDRILDTLAWKEARMVFLDTPLGEVLAQFNRRNSIQIVLGDADLASLPVDGNFRAKNVDAFVRLITGDHEIVAEPMGTDRIVLRRAKR
jgi:transmembrane sensor